MATLNQRSCAGGEVSPSLYGRVDMSNYSISLRTMRNVLTRKHGGGSNRQGTKFVGPNYHPNYESRLVEFAFDSDNTMMLEFGNSGSSTYLRVIKNGVFIKASTKTITGITQANPGVVTISAHGFATNETIEFSDISGMTELNGRTFKAKLVLANTFALYNLDDTPFDTSSLTAYTSGGTAENIYQLYVPSIAPTRIPDFKYVQSGNVLTIVHPSIEPLTLTRVSDDEWVVASLGAEPSISAPAAVNTASGSAGAVPHIYSVSSVKRGTFEESYLYEYVNLSITSIVSLGGASTRVTTSASHFLTTYHDVILHIGNKFSGDFVVLNGGTFKVQAVTATTFDIIYNTVGFSGFSAIGHSVVSYDHIETVGGAFFPTVATPISVYWDPVEDAHQYNVYKKENGVWGLHGISLSASSAGVDPYTDIGQSVDLSSAPLIDDSPFNEANEYPSAVSFYQQRLVLANTNNNTEKVYMSQINRFKNFSQRSVLTDSDSVVFSLAGKKVNAVKSMVDIGRLVLLTQDGEWAALGDGSGIITPTQVNPKQYSYNGSGDIDPVIINNTAIYLQGRGSILRDLVFSFSTDGYTGTDLTVFSSHLFKGYTIEKLSYQQNPHSIVWALRSDGVLLGLTYIKDHDMLAWHRHDFDGGIVEDIAVVPEGNNDALYVTVNRTIDSTTQRYIERVDAGEYTDIVEAKCLDSYKTYDGRNTTATTMTLSGGTTWAYDETITLTASTSYFSSDDVGKEVHLTDSAGDVLRFSVNTYSSATVVTGKPSKTVPSVLRSVSVSDWSLAIKTVGELWHLEGEDVSVFADGYVAASPYNDSYTTVTVSNGSITLSEAYGLIHVGLPYISDIETLDVDTVQGETLLGKNKLVNKLTMLVEETRGIWAGGKAPTGDNKLEGLDEVKPRSVDQNYDDPAALVTGVVEVDLKAEWNSNGRVFIRQVDPLPMNILNIAPSGKFPIRG